MNIFEAVEDGHIGYMWRKNNDHTLNVRELPTVCKKCQSPWPCAVIVKARGRSKADRGVKVSAA